MHLRRCTQILTLQLTPSLLLWNPQLLHHSPLNVRVVETLTNQRSIEYVVDPEHTNALTGGFHVERIATLAGITLNQRPGYEQSLTMDEAISHVAPNPESVNGSWLRSNCIVRLLVVIFEAACGWLRGGSHPCSCENWC